MRGGYRGQVTRLLPLAASLVLAAVAFAAPAEATAPASQYDAAGQAHANACMRLASGSEPLRFNDGTPTGFRMTDQNQVDNGQCPGGRVRLDLHELIPSEKGPLGFHRGGNGYADEQNVKYGALAAGDLAGDFPNPKPSSGGRGASCDLAPEPAYRVQVRSIPSIMKYKRPQDTPKGSNSGASFMHYGDPGADQGDRHDVHYSYLVWSFVDVRGGGMVRSLLAPGQVVQACDVHSIAMLSYDKQGNVNGRVTARYVRVLAGNCPIYGWMAWSHNFYGDDGAPAVDHAVPYAGVPPVEPLPDPACPVAAAASRPVLGQGNAADAGGTAFVLSATVNSEGTPALYHFDYGSTPTYSSATPAALVAAADQAVPVSAPVNGLLPATTYHYRLVAGSVHGTTRGPDETFTTPAPRSTAAGLPFAKNAVLGGLKVSPRLVHRASTHRGTTGYIRFKLSLPATVELSFRRLVERKHHRGHWVTVRRTIRATGPAGRNSVRFGGWVASHALARGRYRMAAAPTGASGRPGTARHTSFRLR
jgi:hypothetical protein